MTKLANLRPHATMRGILPDSAVTVVNVRWYGSDALELTSRESAGQVGQVVLYRDEEPGREIVDPRRAWNSRPGRTAKQRRPRVAGVGGGAARELDFAGVIGPCLGAARALWSRPQAAVAIHGRLRRQVRGKVRPMNGAPVRGSFRDFMANCSPRCRTGAIGPWHSVACVQVVGHVRWRGASEMQFRRSKHRQE